jgi:hypothetical protein
MPTSPVASRNTGKSAGWLSNAYFLLDSFNLLLMNPKLSSLFCSAALFSLALPVAQAQAPQPMIRHLDTGYLLHYNFNALTPYSWGKSAPKISGWDVDQSGGKFDFSPKDGFDLQWFKLIDTSDKAGFTIKHQIAEQTAGELTLEFRFRMPMKMDGVSWQLRDMTQAVINITTAGSNLYWDASQGNSTILQPYEASHDYGIKVVADISNHVADVYIDGQLKGHAIPFANPASSIDYVLIKTGDSATGELFLSPVNIYKGYAVNESFVTGSPGSLPSDWTASASTTGSATVEKFACCAAPDIFSLKLAALPGQVASAAKHFPALSGKTIFEYRFMLPQAGDGMSAKIGFHDQAEIGIGTSHGALYCNPGDTSTPIVLAPSYRTNLWYMLKVVADPAAGIADIFLNGKLAASKVAFKSPNSSFDTVNFFATAGTIWIDDVRVYAWHDYPADYVPEPKPCPTKAPYIVGLQSCDLYREGTADSGWEYIYPAGGARKPYLGWYDEGIPEETDWEIKWQVEHGITFELHCWYRPAGDAVGNPIKNGDMDHSIIEGLFNARYSSFKKFAIMYTNDNGGSTTYDDFCQNMVPYWIEYFFKDPRYFKLDGKPVICLYNYDKLKQDLGGADKVKSAVQYLRNEAAKSGFPGLVILTEYRQWGNAPVIQERKAAGFDAIYAYTWFTPHFDEQKDHNLEQRDVAGQASIDQVPSLGMGWDATTWGGSSSGWATKDEYKKTALWVRDTLMPSEPATSLGRRLVLLDNWNEFGEGHAIMPSQIHGFDYLDVIQEVFTDGGSPDDSKPTDQQKHRINILFPRN